MATQHDLFFHIDLLNEVPDVGCNSYHVEGAISSNTFGVNRLAYGTELTYNEGAIYIFESGGQDGLTRWQVIHMGVDGKCRRYGGETDWRDGLALYLEISAAIHYITADWCEPIQLTLV